jgi:hypothetical protein
MAARKGPSTPATLPRHSRAFGPALALPYLESHMASRTTSKRNAVARNRSAEATKAAFDELARKSRNKPVVVSKEQ